MKMRAGSFRRSANEHRVNAPTTHLEVLTRRVIDRPWRLVRRLLGDESGPTAVEYAVMLALIVIVCLSAVKTLGSNASTKFSTVAASLASGS